jgi:transcriptional regulator with XRE-family HTH domain
VNNQSHSTDNNRSYRLVVMALSDRIKERMQSLNLTQDELAQRVGISQTAIHKLLSGKSQRTRYLNELANALGCAPEWLAEKPPSGRRLPPAPADIAPASVLEQREPTVTALLDSLSALIAQADPAVRPDVAHLVLRYLESPEPSPRIAQAIGSLLANDGPDDPAAR